MTILKHELKQNFKSLLIWTLSVAVICAGCIYLYKSVEGQLAETAELYANMGDMTKAIGMDKVSLDVCWYAGSRGSFKGRRRSHQRVSLYLALWTVTNPYLEILGRPLEPVIVQYHRYGSRGAGYLAD